MHAADIWQLGLAAAAAAPFAFGLAFAVRDGREFLTGGLFLLLAAGIAALVCFFTGSVVAAVIAALAPVALLAHARFLGAHRAPAAPAAGDARTHPPAPAAAPATADADALPEEEPPDALHLGMAFIGDVLETADRIGELRHRRRMRQLERRRAEREVKKDPALPERPPARYLPAEAGRVAPRLLPPR